MMQINNDDYTNHLFDVTGDVCFVFRRVMGAVSSAGGKAAGALKGIVDDAAEGVVDFVEMTAEEIGAAVADLAQEAVFEVAHFSSDVIDGVTHVVEVAGEAMWDAAEEGWEAAQWVGARGIEMVGAGTALVGPALEMVGDVAEVATLGLGDDVLDVVDDALLDSLDELTGGVIDIDYDDGALTASVGIDDVAGIGLSIGEDGLSAESEVVGGALAMGVGDDGLLLDVEGGVDIFPLPYVDTHIEVDPDGNVIANGTLQGPIPIPAGDGILAGRVSGGFERSDDGWAVSGEVEGAYLRADGTEIRGEAGIAYAENEEGSAFSAHAAGSFKNEFGEVSGGVGYSRIEQGGEVLETFEAEAHARGFGAEVGAEANYVGIETDEGSVSEWQTDAAFRTVHSDTAAPAPSAAPSGGEDLLGLDGTDADSGQPFGGTVPPSVDPVLNLSPEDASWNDEIAVQNINLEGVESDVPAEFGDTAAPVEPEPAAFNEAIDSVDDFEDTMDNLFDGLD